MLAGGDHRTAISGKVITDRRMTACDSLTCNNRQIFGILRPLETMATGRQRISVLNINCADAAGALSVTIQPGGQTLQLVDDGNPPDLVAGDGTYAALWQGCQAGSYTLNFSNCSSAAVQILGSPPLPHA